MIPLVGEFIGFIPLSFMYFFTNTLAASYEMILFYCKHNKFFQMQDICLGHVKYRNIYITILSMSAVSWDLRILRACLRVSSASWPVLIAVIEWGRILEETFHEWSTT